MYKFENIMKKGWFSLKNSNIDIAKILDMSKKIFHLQTRFS